jgi:hypothetical protein
MTHEAYLTTDEICGLIKVCASNGVTSFKLGPLEVSFGLKPQEAIAPWREQSPPVVEASGQPPEDSQAAYSSEEVLLRDELSTRQDQLAEMLVTDPLEYERLISEGELTNEEVRTE